MKLVLFAGANALMFAAVMNVAASPSDEALIRRQSQEFSDASASGDAAVLSKYLDDNVTFMIESGDLVTKKDIVGSAQPSTNPAVFNHLTQQDFDVKIFGDTAVTSFTDHSVAGFYGQSIVTNFRSTEVWRKGKKGWLMISSQTVSVNDDPPAINLPQAQLAEYVGRYRLADNYVLAITQDGDNLFGSINGGVTSPIKVEVKDVLFVPGQPSLRRIAQRDASGAVVAFLSRHQGHDLVLTRIQ